MPRPVLRGKAIETYFVASPGMQLYMAKLATELELLANANLQAVRAQEAIDAQSGGSHDPLGGASIRLDHPTPSKWRVILHDVGRQNMDGSRGTAAANIIELGRPNRVYRKGSSGGGIKIGGRRRLRIAQVGYGYGMHGKFILTRALKALMARH